MNKVSMRDILDAAYETKEPPPLPTIINTALLLIDVQNLASPEHLKASALKAGLPEDGVDSALADYSKRFYAAVANCATLLDTAATCSPTFDCLHSCQNRGAFWLCARHWACTPSPWLVLSPW